jgi:lysophospholipase L1-like esterase
MHHFLILLFLLTASLLPAQEAVPSKPNESAKWESGIAAIERLLQVNPPAPGGIVFTGSSSIRLWDLKKYFPDSAAVNCGFGGSAIQDSTHFAPRLLFPLKPHLIVFYAGDNDSAAGHSAARIADDFQAFAKTIHATLPDCRILYLPIKPSIAREKLLPLQKEANALIAQQCTAQPARLQYLDLATPLLGKDGALRPELYEKDGLHLSPAGYEIWSSLLRPILAAAEKAAAEKGPVKARSWLPQKARPVTPPATPR